MATLKNLQIRADLFFLVRRFFRERKFLEVETPIRIPAPIPEAHIDAVPSEGWHLHTSPESCMKRLLAQGFPPIFQICRVFRENELGARHLPEFTMLEWYRPHADYTALMEDCQDLVLFCARELGTENALRRQGQTVDLAKPWPRLSVEQAFTRYSRISMAQALAGERFDEAMAFEVEPGLGPNPVFLVDYPIQKAALARPKPGNPDLAERFELYIGGMELANAFSELTDTAAQKARFQEEETLRRQAGKAPYPPPDRFLQALETLPPCAGIALGMDRLAMLFTGAADIAQVSAFTPESL